MCQSAFQFPADFSPARAQVPCKFLHELNESFGKQHPDAGKYIVGTGTIHGGEYTNIIADHVVLNGNIRADHEWHLSLEQLHKLHQSPYPLHTSDWIFHEHESAYC